MGARPQFGTITAEDKANAAEVTPLQPVRRETNVATLASPKTISGPSRSTTALDSVDTVVQLPPSYSWGTPVAGNWTQTTHDDKVRAGDTMRFTHRMKIPFLQRWQTDTVIRKFQADGRFQLRYFALNEETRTIVIEATALTSFSPVPLIAAAVVIILGGAFIWVTTLSIERLGTFTFGDTKVNVAPLVVFGILAVVGLSFFKKG